MNCSKIRRISYLPFSLAAAPLPFSSWPERMKQVKTCRCISFNWRRVHSACCITWRLLSGIWPVNPLLFGAVTDRWKPEERLLRFEHASREFLDAVRLYPHGLLITRITAPSRAPLLLINLRESNWGKGTETRVRTTTEEPNFVHLLKFYVQLRFRSWIFQKKKKKKM